MDRPNGILASVRGEEIATAANSLPPATEGQPHELTVDIDAQHIGRVRLTFELKMHKRARHRHWFWCAAEAHAIDALPDSAASQGT